MNEMIKRKKVLSPVENNGKTFWRLLGTAFVNKDNSINVFLDGLPVNGRLQLRDWDEAPRHERHEQQPLGLHAISGGGMPAQRPVDDLPF